jgi:LPS sulfotransferase NodH
VAAYESDAPPLPVAQRPLWDAARFRLEWRRLKHGYTLSRKWWLRKHEPYQPLFVIASFRSGSNLLLSYLAQQPGVSMLGEVLCHRLPIGPRRPCQTPANAVRQIRRSLQGERTPIRGCKLMLDQLKNCRLSLDHLNSAFPDAKYIVLYRQSLAEQFVSHRLAWLTQQFVLRPGEKPRRAELTIDPDDLRQYCDQTRSGYREVLNHPWLAGRAVLLSYEELTADTDHWLAEHICPLLAVPVVTPATRLLKQNTLPLDQQITNYRDVAGLLESSLCQQHHVGPWQRGCQFSAA